MNYYIQGDSAKADKIRAAFERLGYDTSFVQKLSASDNHILFTLPCDYRVHAFHMAYIEADILKRLVNIDPDYKELELPVEPKFKVGDWIVSSSGIIVGIINKIRHYGYFVELMNGEEVTFTKNHIEQDFHLWTIADAKDGDVLVTTKIRSCPFIYRKTSYNNRLAYYYAGIDGNGNFCEGCLKRTLFHFGPVENVVPATKEQRDLLFQKMKEAGYEWDADKKELNKIQPHYDIANFKPFDKVLVRCGNDEEWMIEFYCKYDTLVHTSPHRDYPFMGIGDSYSQCIPFNDGTKHLLGTTDMCPEEYINW